MKNPYMYICTGIGINGYYNYVKKFHGKTERIRRISKKNYLLLNTLVIRCNSKHLPASFLSNQLDPPNLTIIQITTKTQPNN